MAYSRSCVTACVSFCAREELRARGEGRRHEGGEETGDGLGGAELKNRVRRARVWVAEGRGYRT